MTSSTPNPTETINDEAVHAAAEVIRDWLWEDGQNGIPDDISVDERVLATRALAAAFPALRAQIETELRQQIASSAGVATNESALVTIVRILSETYTDAGVLIWLNAKNKQLRSIPDGNWSCSPAEYIAAGHASEVLACARRIEGVS